MAHHIFRWWIHDSLHSNTVLLPSQMNGRANIPIANADEPCLVSPTPFCRYVMGGKDNWLRWHCQNTTFQAAGLQSNDSSYSSFEYRFPNCWCCCLFLQSLFLPMHLPLQLPFQLLRPHCHLMLLMFSPHHQDWFCWPNADLMRMFQNRECPVPQDERTPLRLTHTPIYSHVDLVCWWQLGGWLWLIWLDNSDNDDADIFHVHKQCSWYRSN